MATPTLQEVLARVPAVEGMIDEMNELIPGVPADPRNMKTLLQHLERNGGLFTFNRGDNQPRINMNINKDNKKSKFIVVQLWGPVEMWVINSTDGGRRNNPQRPLIEGERFDCTEDGLLKAIITAKKLLGKLRTEGTCPDCRNAAGELPSKRLKADNMPKCWDCMIRGAMGV
jgi:hypothetical protein